MRSARAMTMPLASTRNASTRGFTDTRYADAVTRLAIAAVIIQTVASSGVAHADTKTGSKKVSRVRGLPVKKPIDEEQVTVDELRTRLAALAGDRTAEGVAAVRWGLVPLD